MLQHVRAKFDRTMETLRTQGIAYDPRDRRAMLPYGEAGRLARAAQKSWRDLQETEADREGYVRTVGSMTEKFRQEATELLHCTEQAWRLHDVFILGAHRYALRWRVVGKTVVFKVRWVRKVLRPFRA